VAAALQRQERTGCDLLALLERLEKRLNAGI
jgi:hypothetical protein